MVYGILFLMLESPSPPVMRQSLKSGCPTLLPEHPATTANPLLGWSTSPSGWKNLLVVIVRHGQTKESGCIKYSLFPALLLGNGWKWQRVHCAGLCVVHVVIMGMGTPSVRGSPWGCCGFCTVTARWVQWGSCSAVEVGRNLAPDVWGTVSSPVVGCCPLFCATSPCLTV